MTDLRDVTALRDVLVGAHKKHGRVFVGLGLARAVLASDWLAERDGEFRAGLVAVLDDCDHQMPPQVADRLWALVHTAPDPS